MSSRPLHVSALHTLPSERRHSASLERHQEKNHGVAIHPLRQHPPSFIIHEDNNNDNNTETDTAYHGFVTEPAAAHTAGSSSIASSASSTCYNPEPSLLEDYPVSSIHQQSQTSFFDKVKLPPIVTSTASRASLHLSASRTSSPERHSRSLSRPSLSNWFTGSSAPVSFALSTSPTRGEPEPDSDDPELSDMETIFTTRPGRIRTSTSTSQVSTASSGLASKFSWIAKGIGALPTPTTTTTTTRPASPTKRDSPDANDELLTLEISRALLPQGTPDILAPSSFYDLLATSEALCQKYKTAYCAKVHQVAELEAEKDAVKDELDEAEMRCRHFKMQLDGMAARAKEQEENMRKLRQELLAERRRREDEERARQRSVQLVRGGKNKPRLHSRLAPELSPSGSTTASDSGFESDGDSSNASARSRRTSSSSSDLDSASPTLADHESFEEHHEGQRMQVNRRLSTYDKVLKNVASGDPASAWAVMEGYRDENRELKSRIKELEDAVENALDMVVCMGI